MSMMLCNEHPLNRRNIEQIVEHVEASLAYIAVRIGRPNFECLLYVGREEMNTIRTHNCLREGRLLGKTPDKFMDCALVEVRADRWLHVALTR